MRVVGIDGFSGLTGMIRKAVSRLHEVALEFLVEDFNLRQPLTGSSADPPGHERAHGKAVVLRERLSVHVGSKEGIFIQRFLNGNAACKRRHFAEDYILA